MSSFVQGQLLFESWRFMCFVVQTLIESRYLWLFVVVI